MSRFNEIREELAQVLAERGGTFIDAALPPLAYLIGLRICCTDMGVRLAILAALLMVLVRMMLRQSILSALGGLLLAGAAAGLSILSLQSANFFLPGLVSSGVVALACVVSLALKRPLAAWTSYWIRRWPVEWYQHQQVAPAYRNVTGAWAIIFVVRFALQYYFYAQNAVGALAATQLFLGWPMIILLLIASYLYGTWDLGRLGGPSVEEFKKNKKPPWKGQQRGF